MLSLTLLLLGEARVADSSSPSLKRILRAVAAGRSEDHPQLAEDAVDVGGAASTVLSYSAGCELGKGFSFGQMGCISSAVATFPDCDELGDNLDMAPCTSASTSDSDVQSYETKVTSSSEMSDLMDASITAEGHGWGMSASVSASYMSSQQSSSNSVAFYTGGGGTFNAESIQYAENLGLSTGAIYDLKTDPAQFISDYGRFYVSSISYGGSFIGSIEIQNSMNSDSSSLSVAASFSYGDAFSASGSFSESMESCSSYTRQSTKIMFTGGSVDNLTASDGAEMETRYTDWLQNVEVAGNGKPITITLSSWYDIDLVQDYVNQCNNETIKDLFKQAAPGDTVMSMISKEYIFTGTAKQTVENTLGFECAVRSSTFTDALNDVLTKITTHKSKIDNLSENDIYAIEAAIEAGDESWFQATNGDFSIDDLVTANPACKSCNMPQFTFYGDRVQKVETANTMECTAKCVQLGSECESWTFMGKHCYLRSNWGYRGDGEISTDVSGPRSCNCYSYGDDATNASEKYIVAWTDTDTTKTSSPEQCQAWCQDHSECKFFGWLPAFEALGQSAPAGCFLYSKSGTSNTASAVAGPSECANPLDL